ncbi:lantibiotic dehydratase [Nonomuraea sp. NPDC049480]|uniref:lantibiotic dehydratase n=1 Tax=Nonomuraea sp. NPDC049480 TaxID=3364353 RepID=UPI0037B2463A
MYQYADAALLRATTWQPNQQLPPWPDLTSASADQLSWRRWLGLIWQIPALATAVQQASPDLAQRIGDMLDGHRITDPDARRLVLSTMRYLLRAQTRATPFGMFAGIAPARIAPARQPSVRISNGHDAVLHARSAWLAAVVDRLESTPALRRRLPVRTNDLLFERDGQIVLQHRSHAQPNGRPAHVSVRATDPLRAALRLAHLPVPCESLHAQLAVMFPTAAEPAIDALLADLVRERLLLTSLRPPATASDPLGHLLGELAAVDADTVGETAETIKRLREIAEHLGRPQQLAHLPDLRKAMTRATATMRAVHPTTQPLALDVRLNAEVAMPAAVAKEAAAAASVLIRLARRPALSSAWIDWHQRFLERYGPHALIPVLDAVDADIGLGYPAGYLGAAPPQQATPTKRDTHLLPLAQRAALLRQREIVLDDELIDRLSVVGKGTPIQTSTELTVRVDAPTAQALAAGAYTLAIVGVSRQAGTTTGRFLPLLGEDYLQRVAALYAQLPTATRGALTAQISAPPLHTSSGDVARAPQTCTHLLPIGEYHDGNGRSLTVADLAITADARRLYVMSRSRRRAIEPLALNAVNPASHIHPLVRFLIEAPHALSTPCTPFEWGLATALPFLPALRYGRTIISPARWLLAASDLPGREASWPDWDCALATWREQTAVPSRVYLGEGDRRIILDLDEPAHRALLRAHLHNGDTAVLLPAPAPDAAGWIGGHAHELVLPLKATIGPADPPARAYEFTGRGHGYLPGQDGRLYLKLYGHPDRHTSILTRHLPHLAERLEQLTGPLTWWFLRYHDPDDHLRIRMTVPPDTLADAILHINAWSDHLRHAGLIGRLQWDTYFPEIGRFGGPEAMDAAEAYFAADSAAVLAQLMTSTTAPSGPDTRALTAASLLNLTIALLGDTAAAMRWMIDHTRPDSQAPRRDQYDQALTLALAFTAGSHRNELAAHTGGQQVLACWERRRTALTTYRTTLEVAGVNAADLLPDLLHLHHVRMISTSRTSERACLHLARAAALSWTARTTRSR